MLGDQYLHFCCSYQNLKVYHSSCHGVVILDVTGIKNFRTKWREKPLTCEARAKVCRRRIFGVSLYVHCKLTVSTFSTVIEPTGWFCTFMVQYMDSGGTVRLMSRSMLGLTELGWSRNRYHYFGNNDNLFEVMLE